MPVSFFGLYRGDGTATADSLFGRRGNNPYSHYRILKLPERGTHVRTLMLGCVIALRYLSRFGVIRDRVVPATGPAMSAMPLSGSNCGALATPRRA
jgi:hypothetical protein